jgi:murein DD-endopeptidase MepM/ murein hydrolase activator NlpD
MGRVCGTLLARRTHVRADHLERRRPGRRVVISVPFVGATDLVFVASVRAPRSRAPRQPTIRRWARVFSRCGLLVANVAAPAAIVLASSGLARLNPLAPPAADPAPIVVIAQSVERSTLVARHPLDTVTTPDPPQLTSHVVAPGETLLSIAAKAGIAPQTLAYDNGIVDSAQLKVGQSLVVPPFDAAVHVVRPGDTIEAISATYNMDPNAVRALNRVASDDSDVAEGRVLFVPVPDARYPGFRLRLSDAPRVLAPQLRWPAEGVITQLFSPAHLGVDIAAPYGSAIVAADAGTVSQVGWRGDGGLAVCIRHDWGLETCAYHAAVTYIEVGERVVAGQRIAAIGTTGVTTGPHVHWEARTNGALVDPLTYAPLTVSKPVVGGATGGP